MKTVFKTIFCAFLAFVIAIAIITVIEVGKVQNTNKIAKEPYITNFPYENSGINIKLIKENKFEIKTDRLRRKNETDSRRYFLCRSRR